MKITFLNEPRESQCRIEFDKRLLDLIRSKQKYSITSDRHLIESNTREVMSILEMLKTWKAQDNFGNTLLHYAAKHDNTLVVDYLVSKSNSIIDIRNDSGQTPLIMAIESNSPYTIDFLLKADADIYNHGCPKKYANPGRSALFWFFHGKYVTTKILETVLDKVRTHYRGNDILIADVLCRVDCPMYHVVLFRNIELTKIMLERGCPVDACTKGHQTALHKAVQLVDVEQVKLLLEHNADPNALNKSCRSPLHDLYVLYTIHSNDHLQMLKMLIARNVALTHTIGGSTWSQVNLVLRYGNKEAIEALLSANFDVNSKDEDEVDQNTPLHILASNRTRGVFSALDNHSFDANARNSKSKGLLHYAVFCGCNAHTVKYLLNRGADVNALDIDDLIWNKADQRFVEILLTCGVDIQWRHGIPEGLLKMFNDEIMRLLQETVNVLIANLVVQKARGVEITERTRGTIAATNQAYYDFCEEQLGTVVYDSVTLIELLCASELKFEQYARNQQWASKMEDFCKSRERICHTLGAILQRRIDRTVRIIELKMDAACVLCTIMKAEYASIHLIADRVTNFLSERDLQNLLLLSL